MINQGKDVPKNTIVIFEDSYDSDLKPVIKKILKRPDKTRDWFDPHFYKCLPLKIGNQYGFVLSAEFDFSFEWNGENGKDAVTFFVDDDSNNYGKFPAIESHFGHGIITINPPFTLRTPPGVNLMTINPPNYFIPNITAMTGVIETDNLRRNFTFNLKIQMPGIRVFIPAGTPLAAFIPIPRYFSDEFELVFADEVFDKETIEEEDNSAIGETKTRQENDYLTLKPNRRYMRGIDLYGNKFPDHQI
jgi:hypothetical protein